MQEENKKVKVKETEEREHEQQVWSWGAGTDGQLGTGKLEDEHLPQLLQFPSLSVRPISSLACGGAHVIALNSGDGKVLTWGRGTSGQLGHGNMLSSVHPQPVTFLDSFVITHISAGWSHSGFVSDKGCVFTCGDGSFGQLGHGDNNSHATPVQVSYFANRHVHQIACGMRHSLVLLKGNQVYGFGSGKRGQLGISKDKIKSISLPLVTCGFEDIKINSIITNGDHSAALSVDGHLYTWGRGFPGTSDVFTPRHLVSSLQFIKVALGWNHALALTGNFFFFCVWMSVCVYCDPTHAIFDRVSILDGMKVVDIAAGSEHSALLTGKMDGTIKTWGWGEHGQLGLGSTKDQTNPQSVSLDHEAENQEINLKVYCGSGFTFVVRSLSTSQT
ncbi:protein with unknown function [Ricinus communis]|uniref:RCC1-like domain-containing protein n=1 Tax=Ricinus communis TaxID=3988 RepID=B9S2D2_RICCO|nr:protein with unknown function [Ricinus communis]